jgi:hypothetical protein
MSLPDSPKKNQQRNLRFKLHHRSHGFNRHLQNIPSKSCGIQFFIAVWGTFSTIDYILEHKVSPNKYEKVQMISCILSDQNWMSIEINSKRHYRKFTNTWCLNSILLNGQWIIGEIREEIKNYWSQMKIIIPFMRTCGTQWR